MAQVIKAVLVTLKDSGSLEGNNKNAKLIVDKIEEGFDVVSAQADKGTFVYILKKVEEK